MKNVFVGALFAVTVIVVGKTANIVGYRKGVSDSVKIAEVCKEIFEGIRH